MLDPDDEQRLTAEAEAGFDPATLVRRPAGRPSLSERAGHSNRVDLCVDDETYQAIQRIDNQGNRKVSDVVREAIRQYLEAS
ncbi:MAG TPA: ribbon-helix-helix protein, CopG family [Mycobacteriales bacterium]|nr:ribbon-helix-helix protein, CopG family [Mycobacteriales bacterium]